MRRVVAVLLLLAGLAGLSRTVQALEPEPELSPPPAARLALDLAVRDEAGQATTLRAATAGAPILLAFADYRCTVLCGTAIGLLASVLPETGLQPGRDFALVVIGLDPRDGPADAAAMRRASFGEGTALAAAAHLLVAEAPVIRAATAALGYRALWQADADRFDHPLAVMVLAPDGRLAATLPGLGLDEDALRDALLAARSFSGVPLAQRVLLACQAVLGAGGARGVAILLALGAGVAVALACLGGFALLLRLQRRPGA